MISDTLFPFFSEPQNELLYLPKQRVLIQFCFGVQIVGYIPTEALEKLTAKKADLLKNIAVFLNISF